MPLLFFISLSLFSPFVNRSACKRKPFYFVQNVKIIVNNLFIIDFSSYFRYYLIINGL